MHNTHTCTLPKEFMAQKNGKLSTWQVYAYLNGFFINRLKVWASNETIASKINMSKCTVTRAVKELEKLGFIECVRTKRTRVISLKFIEKQPIEEESDNEDDQDEKPEKPNESSDNSFEEFWKEYPKKIAKGKAKMLWQKLKKEKRILCITAIKKQNENNHFYKDWLEKDSPPQPTTWLKEERWEDEVFLIKRKQGKAFLTDNAKKILEEALTNKTTV